MFSVTIAALMTTLLGAPAPRSVPSGMTRVPAGVYTPLHGAPVRVAAFALDREPVTRADFLAFVRTHRDWARGAAGVSLVEKTYLADWSGPFDAGSPEALSYPVVNVSWHAASAYCAARGARLPTTAEWERAAMASVTRADGTADPAFIASLMTAYTKRATLPMRDARRGERNVFGIYGLHDLVWEWTADFDRAASAGHEHASHGDHADTNAGRALASCASAAIGASNTANYPAFLRDAVRAGLGRTTTMPTLGFRCAAGAG